MKRVYAKINKQTLRYIREKKNISFDHILRVAKISQEKLLSWEDINSGKFPTVNQAKALAACYHVPFAGFYMNSKDIDIKAFPKVVNKRVMINNINDDSAVNLAVEDLINDRDFYVELMNNLKEPLGAFHLTIDENKNAQEWAAIIREICNINLKDQYSLSSKRKFYLYLRKRIEASGVFIQCFDDVEPEILRGVAIVDDSVPIIGINDKDRYPAKSFSIIHEFVHVIKRTSAVCNEMLDSSANDKEEVFCNAVAGETLVPSKELISVIADKKNNAIIGNFHSFDLRTVDWLARKFSVSSEVIARRLLDTQECNENWYIKTTHDLAVRYREDKIENKNAVFARSLPREGIDRTSDALSVALVKGYSENLLDKNDIAAYVRIGVNHISDYVDEVMR